MIIDDVVVSADDAVEIVGEATDDFAITAEQEFGLVLSGEGPQGPQGPKGDQGEQGPQGDRGIAGINGTKTLYGSGVPDVLTGAVGDFYIDISGNLLYGPKTTVWPPGVSMVGPAGPPGSTAFADMVGQAALAQLPTINDGTMLANLSGSASTPLSYRIPDAVALYDTFALAVAAHVPASYAFLETRSYTTDVPNSGAQYRKVLSDPGYGSPSVFQSADGAWWLMNELLPLPSMFGGKANGTTDDTAAVQKAIDQLSARGLRSLWFDASYIVTGLHANGLSCIDWKQIDLVGPGGLKLANNSNVTAAVFTATFSGTTMTISTFTSGSLAAGMFLSPQATGTGLVPATKIVSLASGTANTPGAVYNVDQTNAIASAISLKASKRFVEMLGNYDTVTGLVNARCEIDFDYNGANNCDGGTIWTWNTIVTINKGSGNVFDGAKFRNNSGSNSIVLGVDQASPSTLFDTTVIRCLFENDGDRTNPASLDYSTIFSFSDGLSVVGNTYRRGASKNGCPWEVYNRNILVAGNKVQGYYNTANICAVPGQTTRNVNFIGNTIEDCSVGFTLWAVASTSKLWGVNIANNTLDFLVVQPGGPYVVNGIGQINAVSELRDVNISGNIGRNSDLSDTTRSTDGISLQACYSAKISNNQLYGFPGRGVYLTNTYNGGSFDVSHNQLTNVGYTSANSALKSGITIDASAFGPASLLIVKDNEINPLAGYKLTTGILCALDAEISDINNPAIVGATSPIKWTGAGAASNGYMLRQFGSKGDGLKVTATVTITAGTKNLHITGLSFKQSDVGKIIFIQGAAASGGTLQTSITGVTGSNDIVLFDNASTTLTAASKTVFVGTDDTAAINAAITYCKSYGKTLVVTDGMYLHTSTINWAWIGFKVHAYGDNVAFLHAGTGVAHNFNGFANYGGQGCINGVFGGPGRIMLRGNPNGGTTIAAQIDNWHFGSMKIAARDCSSYLVQGNDSGIVGASAVESIFDIQISPNVDNETFLTVPACGVEFTRATACVFPRLVVESCGVASRAVRFLSCVGNLFNGGTVESNVAGGILFDSGCFRNVVKSIHCEANGSQEDFYVDGYNNTFEGCASGATTLGSKINGSRNVIKSGDWAKLQITATAAGTRLENVILRTSYSDLGTQTTNINFYDPDGLGLVAIDNAVAILGNKTINTDNGSIIKIASVDVSTAWTAYTPTLTAATGAFTTATVTGRYKQIGKTVHLHLSVVVTAANTASGAVIATLPAGMTPAAQAVGALYERAVTGKMGSAQIPSGDAHAYLRAYDGSTLWVNGYTIEANLTFEIT